MNTSRKIRNNGTLIVLVHIAALLGHASSHVHLTIGVDTWQSAFIAIVIFAAPLFAMILLWMRFLTAGVYVARDLNGWIVDIRSLLSLSRRGCGQCLWNGPGHLEHCISHYRWAACGDRGSGLCLVRVDSCASKPERSCSDQVVIVGVGRGRVS